MKHLAAVAVAAAAVTASAIAGPAPTAAAWHVPDPPFAAPALAIQRLTDAQLAGQRVIYSYPGPRPGRGGPGSLPLRSSVRQSGPALARTGAQE